MENIHLLERIKKIKKIIENFINEGKIDLAKEYIEKYESLVKNDIEIYSMKAIILIIENKCDEAHLILQKALILDCNNFDILYNLAYINTLKENYEMALKYYKMSYKNVKDINIKKEIEISIHDLLNNCDLCCNIDSFLHDDNVYRPRILILCAFYSVYTKEYIEKMNTYKNYKFDILTMESSYSELVNRNAIENIYLYNNLQNILDILGSSDKYDIIHIHFLTPFYGEIARLIKQKCNKLIVTIWGSDFYRTNNNQKEIQRNIVNLSDIITFDNEVTMKEFCDYYGRALLGKTSINLFGLTALEYIKKLKNDDVNKIKKDLDIPENSIVITCGYNANSAHNHIQIIDAIKKIKNKLPTNSFFIFPMTYGGNSEYINSIKRILKNSDLKFKVIEDFMNFSEIAKITKSTDILVQVQITDTLSATMQEHLFNGNLIITGNWLPYSPLKERGIYFEEISEINEVGTSIVNSILKVQNNIDKLKENEDIIWRMSAWENTIESWNDIYNKDIKALFNHKSYWNDRYSMKYNIESAGSMGLGEIYNNYLYKSKLEIIDYLVNELFVTLKNKNVLELGPGTGFYTEYFYDKPLKEYFGIEISEVAVNNLESKFKNFTFQVGDVSNDLCYLNNIKYDLIFAANVLLHLTDEEKFEKTIYNISNVLNDEGYFIDIEPITLTSEKTNSLYHNIIDIIYIEKVLEKYNLEICSNISPTFFMNYPFDYNVVNSDGKFLMEIFNCISKYFNTSNDMKEYKEKISEALYYLDKLCLLKYNIGTCEKILTIRKKRSSNIKRDDLNVLNIWNEIEINKKLNYLKEFMENNIDNSYLKQALKMINEKLLNRSNDEFEPKKNNNS